MHNIPMQALILLAVFLIAIVGFAVDAIVLTPLRIRRAQRIAQEQLAKMRFAAGAHAHLPRKVRRARARAFAKKLTILARVTGTTAGLPRHEVRRRQKGLANAIARVG